MVPASVELVAFIAAVYGFLFLLAVLGKVDGWRAWSRAISGFFPGHKRVAAGVRVVVPIAEAGVAALCVALPKLGLLAAGSALATFAVLVSVLLVRHQGEECNCFGAVASSRIDKSLVVRDVAASGLALGVAVGAWNLAVRPLSALACGVLVLLVSLLLVASEYRNLRSVDVRRLGVQNLDGEA